MPLIETTVPAARVYSSDECFADLTSMTGSLIQFGREVRAKVMRPTDIPFGVWIARTKTMAQVGYYTEKRLQTRDCSRYENS